MLRMNGKIYSGHLALLGLIWITRFALVSSICSGGKRNDENGVKAFLCYWGTWSVYKMEPITNITDGAFDVDDIDPDLCTHIIYSFAGLNDTSNEIESLDRWMDYEFHNSIERLIKLKEKNSNLKVLIAIGGWGQGSERFSVMAADPDLRNIFVENMDWEYPAKRGGAPEDKDNFVLLLKDLREAFDVLEKSEGRDIWLTAAVGAGKDTIDAAYDVRGISQYLDCINIMAYDFKVYVEDEWEMIGHHSPLHAKPEEDEGNAALTVSHAVEYFLEKGAPANKLALGVGAYGKTYNISNLTEAGTVPEFYDQVDGPGFAFGFSQEPGTVTYYEICYYLVYRNEMSLGWNFKFDNDYIVPFAYNSTTWIGYDDERSVVAKVDYAEEKGLGGMMIWSIDQDDFKNWCEGWVENPIGNAVKNRMKYHQIQRGRINYYS